MSITIQQSAISELSDQICLDFADGKYLNIVSANLGVNRPLFGFDDKTWRAVVKVLALDYKQILHKFEDVLEILFGPKITQVSTLAEPAVAGDTQIKLTSSDGFPQVGTIILDELLVSHETVTYNYIDRVTNIVYLDVALVNSHTAIEVKKESFLSTKIASGSAAVGAYDGYGWPDPGVANFTVIIGRGTPFEQVNVVTSISTIGKFGLLNNTTIDIPDLDTSAGDVQIVNNSVAQSYILGLDSIDRLVQLKGHLLVSDIETLTCAGGSSTTSVVTTATLTANSYPSYRLVFTGNITGALRGAVAYVSTNTSNTFSLYNTLPGTPAAGDTFKVEPNIEYYQTNPDNTVLMKTAFPDLLISTGFVSMIKPVGTIAVAQVQVKSGSWDMFQVNANNLEILLPEALDAGDPRRASYLHDKDTVPETAVANATRTAGDFTVSVTSTVNLPTMGTAMQNAGAQGYFSYYIPSAELTADAASGATTIIVTDTSQFPASGTLRLNGSNYTYTVVDGVTITTAALGAAAHIGDQIRELHILSVPGTHGIPSNVAISDNIDLYTNVNSGNVWVTTDVFPGPYVYDIESQARKDTTTGPDRFARKPSTQPLLLAGPTKLSVDSNLGTNVLELEDASAFDLTQLPYSILIGENTGDEEEIQILAVALKQRTYTTISSSVTAGDTSIQATALSGPTGPANVFPSVGQYRLAVNPGQSNFEIVIVDSTSTGPNRFNLVYPVVNSHSNTEPLYLISDLVKTATPLLDNHVGIILESNRREGTPYPTALTLAVQDPTMVAGASLVRQMYLSVTLDSTATGFAALDGHAVINFGRTVIPATATVTVGAAGATVITVDNSSVLPSASGITEGRYVVYIGYGRDRIHTEECHVINNNTGTNQITITHPLLFSQVGFPVVFLPGNTEEIEYTTATGSTLSFNTYLNIQSTHYACEPIGPTVGACVPRTDGYSFPFRVPTSAAQRLQFLLDLIRAAGVNVTIIHSL